MSAYAPISAHYGNYEARDYNRTYLTSLVFYYLQYTISSHHVCLQNEILTGVLAAIFKMLSARDAKRVTNGIFSCGLELARIFSFFCHKYLVLP